MCCVKAIGANSKLNVSGVGKEGFKGLNLQLKLKKTLLLLQRAGRLNVGKTEII